MKIIIDTEVLNENKLTPTQYVMLHFKYKGIPHTIGPNMLRVLEELGFCDAEYTTLTDKAISLFNKDLKQMDADELKEFLEELRNLFPDKVKGGGGQFVKSAISDAVFNKLKKFVKDYSYSKETIIKATKMYVEDRKRQGYIYMKVFTYFINKEGEGSTLAAWCEQVEKGILETSRNLGDYNIKVDK